MCCKGKGGLEKVKGGYKVKPSAKHPEPFSKKPQSRSRALAQLRVIEMHKRMGGK